MTPAGIVPATFWFVAQHLNHCATAPPPTRNMKGICEYRGQQTMGGPPASGLGEVLTTHHKNAPLRKKASDKDILWYDIKNGKMLPHRNIRMYTRTFPDRKT